MLLRMPESATARGAEVHVVQSNAFHELGHCICLSGISIVVVVVIMVLAWVFWRSPAWPNDLIFHMPRMYYFEQGNGPFHLGEGFHNSYNMPVLCWKQRRWYIPCCRASLPLGRVREVFMVWNWARYIDVALWDRLSSQASATMNCFILGKEILLKLWDGSSYNDLLYDPFILFTCRKVTFLCKSAKATDDGIQCLNRFLFIMAVFQPWHIKVGCRFQFWDKLVKYLVQNLLLGNSQGPRIVLLKAMFPDLEKDVRDHVLGRNVLHNEVQHQPLLEQLKSASQVRSIPGHGWHRRGGHCGRLNRCHFGPLKKIPARCQPEQQLGSPGNGKIFTAATMWSFHFWVESW